MNSKHLGKGDVKPQFNSDKKFRLYSCRFCPYAQRTLLVLSAKGIIDHDVVNIKLRTKRPEWYTDINPLGKVPAIEFPNGDKIYESLIISDFLDELYPDVPLHPSDPKKKAEQRLYVETFCSTFTTAQRQYHMERTEENKQAFFEKLQQCENYLNTPFFRGDKPGMVDYMIWPFFERLPIIHELCEDSHPKLSAWFMRMQELACVKAVALPVKTYKEFYDSYFSGNENFDLLK